MNVAVVGGGAVGVTAALELARGGAAVTLLERGDLGSGASGRAAGICYDAFADRRDADLAARSLERFRDLAAAGAIPFEPCPYVWLAREGDDERAAAVREGAGEMADQGLEVALASPADLGERFPALRTDDVAVAAVAEGAGYTDPAAYVEAVAGRAREAGVEIRTDVEVALDLASARPPRVVPAGGSSARSADDGAAEFDAVLVAAGARTPGLLSDAGVQVPVEAYRVQALVAAEGYGAPICFDATGGFYVRPHPRGLLAGDGTEPVAADPDTYDRSGDDWFVAETREGLRSLLGMEVAVERAWAGLCTATPDRDPVVGEVAEGLYVATGFQGHGVMRAPAVGAAVADEIGGGDGIRGFDPQRFDGDETVDIREGMAL